MLSPPAGNHDDNENGMGNASNRIRFGLRLDNMIRGRFDEIRWNKIEGLAVKIVYWIYPGYLRAVAAAL
jgi:hypothetical protein